MDPANVLQASRKCVPGMGSCGRRADAAEQRFAFRLTPSLSLSRAPLPPPRALRSMLTMTQIQMPSFGSEACTEDQLLDAKDAFSDVKRAFLEQQTQASFAKQLRGGASMRTTAALFANLDTNLALAGEAAAAGAAVQRRVARKSPENPSPPFSDPPPSPPVL
jgi:hypothetical protein